MPGLNDFNDNSIFRRAVKYTTCILIHRGYSTSGQCILDLLNESSKNDKNEALAEFLSFLHDEFNKSNIHWPRVLYHIYNMTTERMVTTKVSEIIFNLSLIRPYWNGMFEVSTSVFQNQYRSTLPKVGPSPCRTIYVNYFIDPKRQLDQFLSCHMPQKCKNLINNL